MADIELSSAASETTIDPVNDYVPMVDVSESPDGINKLALRHLRQVEIGIACSDETTALTTGAGKAVFYMPYAMTVTGVRAAVTTAPTGAVILVDIHEGAGAGTTILSTRMNIDISEFSSQDSGTAAVISDSVLADNARINIDIDQVGSTIAGAGLKVWIIGYRT